MGVHCQSLSGQHTGLWLVKRHDAQKTLGELNSGSVRGSSVRGGSVRDTGCRQCWVLALFQRRGGGGGETAMKGLAQCVTSTAQEVGMGIQVCLACPHSI